jgi:uncharacterized protein
MKTTSDNGYVSNRVLKVNVGFMLGESLGTYRDFSFDVPTIRVSDDLQIRYLHGALRFSRTSEGILVQGSLTAGVEGECARCLDPVAYETVVDVEELFAYPNPYNAEFSIGDDGNLDLAPLLRAETLIDTSRRVLCREDCKGLCADCGANLNREICTCDQENIDPRLAKLKDLLNRS